MTTIQASPQETHSKLSRLAIGANFLDGLITFLYLSVIDPLPVGETSVRSLADADQGSRLPHSTERRNLSGAR
jgi:hypothetical protein